jgi:hypothetical protein
MTWDLATTLAMRLPLNPDRADSSISPGLPESIQVAALGIELQLLQRVSMVGAPVWNSASAKLRFLV